MQAASIKLKQTIDISITVKHDVESFDSTREFFVRIFSEWATCCVTTEIAGSGSFLWSDHDVKSAAYSFPVEINTDAPTFLTNFNLKPGIFAVLFEKKLVSGRPQCHPILMSYLDCSIFAIESLELQACSNKIHGVAIVLKVINSSPFQPKSQSLDLEPVILHLDRVINYPTMPGELFESALQSLYVYGQLELGNKQTRMLFGRVHELIISDAKSVNSDDEDALNESASIGRADIRVCVLPGVTDIAKYKESLSSTTYTFELHHEDVYARMFHDRNVAEYNEMTPEIPTAVAAGAVPIAGAPAAKPAKGAAAATASAPVVFIKPCTGPTAADMFLAQCMLRALESSSSIRAHGIARYRLEQLLGSSADLLKEFALRRRGGGGDVSGADEGVVIQEDMSLEVLLAKPSKPIKWTRPADISLRAALDKQLQEQQSRLDGTLALGAATIGAGGMTNSATMGASLSSTGALRRHENNKPRHERFSDKETRLTLSAELHRRLSHPKPAVTVFLREDDEKFLNNNTMGDNKSTKLEDKKVAVLPVPPPQPEPVVTSIAAVAQSLPVGTGTKTSMSKDAGSLKAVGSTRSSVSVEKPIVVEVAPPQPVIDLTATPAGRYALAQAELAKRLAATPFARMVFVVKYDDDDTLAAINDAVAAVNKRALPDIQGSLRSYSFSDKELQDTINGVLDVVTGFMIIDDDCRITVLEGLAGPGQGMQSVFMDIPRQRQNDKDLKILCNPEVLFPDRKYGVFGPDLKRIRIRNKLKKLARRPELYNRKQVDEICFEAVDSVMALKRVQDLKSAKDLAMFPAATSLNKLELLYGEAISREDLDGISAEQQRLAQLKLKNKALKAVSDANLTITTIASVPGAAPKTAETLLNSSNNKNNINSSTVINTNSTVIAESKKSSEPVVCRNPATDCRNPDFESALRDRPEHRVDYLALNREARKLAWESMLCVNQEREQLMSTAMTRVFQGPGGADGAPVTNHKIFIYSQQSLNYKNLAVGEMRHRLSKVKDTTFTYSQDFVSQTLCLADPVADRKIILEDEKSKWMTSSGFLYPKPKTRKDLIEHPKRPSDARIEDLKEPYEATRARDGPSHTTAAGGAAQTNTLPAATAVGELSDALDDAAMEERRKGYTLRIRGQETFGMLEPVRFERPFELSLVGNKSTLPRGGLVAGKTPDKQFFRSVHLGGEENARLIESAAAQEKADWQAKVVVDHSDFKVGGFKIRDRPIQVSRTDDILKGEAKQLALLQLRERTLPSGKPVPFAAAPMSIINTDTIYVSNAAANALTRTTDPSKFVTSNSGNDRAMLLPPDEQQDGTGSESSGSSLRSDNKVKPGQDFIRFIHREASSSKLQMAVSNKRSIAPLLSREKLGPVWASKPL